MIKWLMRRLKGTITVHELEKSGKAVVGDKYKLLPYNGKYNVGSMVEVSYITPLANVLFIRDGIESFLENNVELKKWNG